MTPLWIGFAQERAGVPAITGYTPEQVRDVTNSILRDLVIGPPDFAASVNGEPVLGATERGHMVDVRNVLVPVTVVFVVMTAALAALLLARRDRAWPWRAMARGAAALLVAGVVVGLAVLFFFDAAFLLFHRTFFPQGNFTFDPRTQRLVQIFPQQLWVETAAGLVVVGSTLALATFIVARRRAARLP